MTKLEKLKVFAAEELDVEDNDGYDVSWPEESSDTLFIYVTSSYNYGWQSVDFATSYRGEEYHIKHDTNEKLNKVIRFENGEWVVKEYEIVSECKIKE